MTLTLGDDSLIRTKLVPPRLHRRLLRRPALAARLREALDYRLTVVQAGMGYGKSTVLAGLAQEGVPLVWYSATEEDSDPQRFLSYLIAAFRVALPGLSDAPSARLAEGSREGRREALPQVVDSLVNALAEALHHPTLLVVDDYQFIAHTPDIAALAERFLTYLPPDLHVITATRHPITAPWLDRWRARGEILDIGHDCLAFRPTEVEALFREVYGVQLTPADVTAVMEKTEGWPIAVQMVWQGLRTGALPTVGDLLAPGPTSLGALFTSLAREVLDRQPPDIAAFLLKTALLRELTPAACAVVTGRTPEDSGRLLDQLQELELFVVRLGERPDRHARYHHLFHDFLRQQAAGDPELLERHRRAAEFFQAQGAPHEAIYHWLEAGAFTEAAQAIETAGESAIQAGRLDTVTRWIDALPPTHLADHPLLQAYLGDVSRLRSHFDHALAWYTHAEKVWRTHGDLAGAARALRGQARVFLDQVRPAQAESLLQEALRLTDRVDDRQARARLLELLAENKLNMGKPDEAETLRAEARALQEAGPDEDALSVRVKLRTGRLGEVVEILEGWLETERREAERGRGRPPRGHRETVLLLSLAESFRGRGERAYTLAHEGIGLGERHGSPFIIALAHTRLGHALQVKMNDQRLMINTSLGVPTHQSSIINHQSSVFNPYEQALTTYQTAIAISDRHGVRRTRAEAMWGLTRAYGFLGDLDSAQQAATEGQEITRWAGDPWLEALIGLQLGASYILAYQPDVAVDHLSRALVAFRECGDTLARAATRLWLSIAYHDLKQMEHCVSSLEDALSLSDQHGYAFLFTTPTFLGLPDPRRLVPALLEARGRGRRPSTIAHALSEMGLAAIQTHPGYRLRVQTLGGFRVWRGEVEVQPREWQRDTARRLFQLLLTERGRWLQRDEILDRLWPAAPPDAAQRDFKVALNAVYKALEPTRPPDALSAYVVREGTAYRLRPEADLWLDVTTFEAEYEAGLRLLQAGQTDAGLARLNAALRLYEGDYLPDALYEDWSSEERERLLGQYLRGSDRLAESLVERGRYDEGLAVCQRLVARDPCWERAYRLMMIAHARQGNRPLALRAYQHCVTTLRDELGVPPSPATTSLYHQIMQVGE
ncbi:MAG: transcriptional regulator [Anaerolineae bacterium]|nr:transcriptional regulator [Anaerolineae bacterium]